MDRLIRRGGSARGSEGRRMPRVEGHLVRRWFREERELPKIVYQIRFQFASLAHRINVAPPSAKAGRVVSVLLPSL